jgi:hypothetical protein
MKALFAFALVLVACGDMAPTSPAPDAELCVCTECGDNVKLPCEADAGAE